MVVSQRHWLRGVVFACCRFGMYIGCCGVWGFVEFDGGVGTLWLFLGNSSATDGLKASMEKLPHDVLSNILILLPAKPLAKLRSVSKLWNSLLSQSHFINSHLHRSNNINNNAFSVVLFFNPECNFDLSYTAYDTKYPHIQLPANKFIKLPTNFPYNEAFFKVIGSVNGLICYCTGLQLEDVHIWNPSLSALVTLPRFNMNRPSHYNNKFGIHYRFGFDPKTDDYKIVKLRHGLLQPKVSLEWMQVEVYSMRKGSWEFIIEKVPPHITRIFDQDEVCMGGYNGYIHWLGAINEKNLQTIVAFDLSAETFSEISLPDSLKYFDKKLSCVLGIKGGKLCVMSSVKEGDDGCDVWVMNKHKVVESWEKHRISFTFKVRMKPIGFTSNDEFIFEIHERSRFALYDPTTNTEKLFNVEYNAYARGSTKIVQYVDSLVWKVKNLQSMGTSLDNRLFKRATTSSRHTQICLSYPLLLSLLNN